MGGVFGALHVSWLEAVEGFPVAGYAVFIIYCSLFYGLFGLLFSFVNRRTSVPMIFAAPVLWTAVEYLRSNFFFLAVPWGLLGHSQYTNIPLIQVASYTSVYGVSFLIVLVNFAVSEIILRLFGKKRKLAASPSPVWMAPAIAVVILAVFLWGYFRVNMSDENDKSILTVSMIQPNIKQNEKWNPEFRDNILTLYRKMTLEAAHNHPDLFIWPESSVPGYVERDMVIFSTVKDLLKKIQKPLLLSGDADIRYEKDGNLIEKLTNNVFLFDQDARLKAIYAKMRLLPFAEYVPYEGKIQWPLGWINPGSKYLAGDKPQIFKLPEANFGVTICWENIFPGLVRRSVLAGAQFIVNLSNEAWFGKTVASRQFLSLSVFRAVENGVAVVRATNTGISGIIDPFGRIYAVLTDEKGDEVMIQGILTASVPPPLGETFYTRHGDVFAGIIAAIAALLILTAAFPIRLRMTMRISP